MEQPDLQTLALPVDQAAASLGISENHVRREVLPAVRSIKIGKVRIVAVELERWLYLNGDSPTTSSANRGHETVQTRGDSPPALHDERLHLQVESHAGLSRLAQVAAQSKAALADSRRVANFSDGSGVWFGPFQRGG